MHDDLQAMVDAFPLVGFEPTVKAGHATGQEDEKEARRVFGAPALGYAKRIWIEGKKLLADLKQVPKKFADLIKAGAFKRISAEIYWDYVYEVSGKKFPRVLKSIAFLGAEIPALTDLKTIESLYQKNAAGTLFAYDEKGNEFRAYNMEPMGPVSPMYPKKDKVAVSYQAVSTQGAERCSTCKFYLYHSCALVEGEIAPEAYCNLYEARNYQAIDENRLFSRFKEMLDSALSIFKNNGKDEVHDYIIEKRGDEWCLRAEGSGKTLGCHDSKEKAEAQERAVQANKHEMLVTAKQMEDICPPCAEKMRQKNFSAIKLLPMISAGGALTYAFPGGMPQAAFEALCDRFSPDEGFRTRCMDSSAAGKVDDPGAFCNALKTACKDNDLLSSDQPAKEYAMKIVEKDGQHCVMDGDETVKCYPTREEAAAHVKKMSKGDPNMDEKKFQDEQAKLRAEKEAAEKKAKEYQDKLVALEASNEEAKSKESEALKKVRKLERERHDDQVRSWIAEQKRAGKIAPVEEPRLRAIFEALYEDQRVVAFAQADGKEVKEPLADAVKAFIAGRPNIFRELSRATDEQYEPLADAGDEIDRKTKEYQAEHNVKDYAEAMKAVLAQSENAELKTAWIRMQRQ